MAELARGDVADRPWGRTLAALGQRGVTGQVNIITDGKLYQIAFSQGAICGAVSPLASDSAARVALTLHLCSSTQVAELSRRTAANPQRDEIDIIAEYARIPPDQAMRLRRRTTAIRAARTFAIEHGDFVVEDRVELPMVPGSEIDVRGIIYMGAAQHLTEARLAGELARLGSWFQIRQEAIPELAQFGFSDAERPILNALVGGTTVSALENSGLDPRSVRAVVYALAASGAAAAEQPQAPRATPVPSRIVPAAASRIAPAAEPPRQQQPARSGGLPVAEPARQVTPSRIAPATASRIAPSAGQQPPSRAGFGQRPPVATPMPDTFSAARTAARQSSESIDMPTLRREIELEPVTLRKPVAPAPVASRRTPAPGAAAIPQIQSLIASRLKLVDGHADHFALLGVSQTSSDEQIRKAYFALARQLHPDRLASLGMTEDAKDGQRLFAQVNAAFGVLSDPTRKAEYVGILKRGGESAVRAEQAATDAKLQKILDSEEAFHRGEVALRRDSLTQAAVEFKKAVELNPDEIENHVLLAWTLFCAASDKMTAGPIIRTQLSKLINKSPQAVAPRFYYARVERMLGRDPEALRIFESVLEIQPNHADSIAEIRVIKQRMKR